MSKLTKRQKEINSRIDNEKQYTIDEAVQILNDLPALKFKESIDIAVNLGVDPRKSDQVVRGATNLPAGTGKTKRVGRLGGGSHPLTRSPNPGLRPGRALEACGVSAGFRGRREPRRRARLAPGTRDHRRAEDHHQRRGPPLGERLR